MNNNLFKRVILSMIFIFTFVAFTGCDNSKYTEEEIGKMLGTNTLPTNYMHITYSFDVTDYTLLVGDADYVFVGEVKNYLKTIYFNDDPRTFYSINVIENIKGELIQDIEIKKAGGINEKHTSFQIAENDFLPKIGEKYIFVVYAQTSDGSLLASGVNSNIKIEKANYKEDQSYLNIIEAYENEVETDRAHNISLYDKNYKSS